MLESIYSLNQPLVNPHLKRIPRFTSLTTRGFSCRDLQALRRKAHGALDSQILALRAFDELLADFFERLDFTAGEGYADFVDFLHRMDSNDGESVEGLGEVAHGERGIFM